MILIFLTSFFAKLHKSTVLASNVTHFYQFDNNSVKYVIKNYIYPDNFEIKTLIEERYTISSLEFRDCTLVKMPGDIFKTLKSLEDLNMAKSCLVDLGDNHFQNAHHLKHIDASFNNITKLDAFTFSGASSVTRLDLSNNQISELQIGSFKGLTKLSVLKLSLNKIKKLSSKFLFHDNLELKEIDLSHNQIHTIDSHPGPFSCLRKLTFLFLNGNFLTDFQHADLAVEDLDVSNNNLTGLMITNNLKKILANSNLITTFYIISNLNVVESIWIINNRISDIKNLAQFSKMSNLKLLQASLNPISDLTPLKDNLALEELYLYFSYKQYGEIDLNIFSNISLKKLDISGNFLKKIDFAPIKINKRMEELFMNSNSLKEFDYKKMIEKFPSIKKIHISDNNFNCSFIQSFLNFTIEKSIEVANGQMAYGMDIKSIRNKNCSEYQSNSTNPSPTKNVLEPSEIQQNVTFDRAISKELTILEHLDSADFDEIEEIYDLMDRHAVLERHFDDFVTNYNRLEILVGLLIACVTSFVIFKAILFYLKRRNRTNYTAESRPFNEFINDENLS